MGGAASSFFAYWGGGGQGAAPGAALMPVDKQGLEGAKLQPG